MDLFKPADQQFPGYTFTDYLAAGAMTALGAVVGRWALEWLLNRNGGE